MDAKSRANFINSIASGQNVACPKCNTVNEPGSKFCSSCGSLLEVKNVNNDVPFAPVKKSEEAKKTEKVNEPVKPVRSVKPVVEYVEQESVFAKGLPEWSIEPPQVMVRRKRK